MMHNSVTATHDPVEQGVTAPPGMSACDPGPARLAPLFTHAVTLAFTAVTDELGRPLVGAFVPDGDLL